MRALVVVALCVALPARAEVGLQPLVDVRVEGDSKVTPKTALRLARVSLGQRLEPADIPKLEAALLSSELFKRVSVRFEPARDGIVLVATLVDKLSWIVAPTLYLLPDNWSFGTGYAENNLFGEDKKLLLYGQVGNKSTLFFGTFFDPAYEGSQLQLRFDIYFVQRAIEEYSNDPDRPTDYTIARSTTWTFADIGLLVGWRFYWWLVGDVRLKPGYAQFASQTTRPERDGWDNSVQSRLTLDRRQRRFGVTSGPYAQVITDISIPGLDDYQYQLLAARAYYSWRFFEEHQLELRTSLGLGRHLPLHEELTLGGVVDLRGYPVDMFRGDRRAVGRAEYSVPIMKYRFFAFRAIGFFDAGYVGYHWRDTSTRDYLPTQHDNASWLRSNVGGGLRVYVKAVVLPLLGLDIAYGLEGKRREIYFEVGLTDF